MRILVTGASGHFGGSAARMLLQRIPARDLILMTRKPEKLGAFKALGCEIRYGDFDDERRRAVDFEKVHFKAALCKAGCNLLGVAAKAGGVGGDVRSFKEVRKVGDDRRPVRRRCKP